MTDFNKILEKAKEIEKKNEREPRKAQKDRS